MARRIVEEERQVGLRALGLRELVLRRVEIAASGVYGELGLNVSKPGSPFGEKPVAGTWSA